MITIVSIPQLKDNYCYIVLYKKNIIIIDPAESKPILKYIDTNKLSLKAILLTHHHADHTAGVEGILNKIKVPVYSPNQKIKFTKKVVKDKDIIDLDFIKIEVMETPGHTNDHIIFYNKKNNILFSGDALFRLGCGRVFEGSYKQMFASLQKIKSLDNKTTVYCGHEYTITNLNFLQQNFPEYNELFDEKAKIDFQLKNTNTSIPFNLGREKAINPFLSTNSDFYKEFKKKNNLSSFELFSHLRDLKNNY